MVIILLEESQISLQWENKISLGLNSEVLSQGIQDKPWFWETE